MPSGSASDQAAYLAEYRKNNPQYVAEQKMRQRARGRALVQLAALHPAEYNRLLAKELQKEKEKARDHKPDQPR